MNHFENNIKILRERFPCEAHLIERAAAADEKFWTEETSRQKTVTAYMQSGVGEKQYIESKIDPAKAAARQAASLDKHSVAVVLGVGLGYILEAISEKLEAADQIIIIERHTALLARALKRADYTALLRSEKTSLVIAYEPSGLEPGLKLDKITAIQNKALVNRNKNYYSQALSSLEEKKFKVYPLKKQERYNILVICEDSLRKDRVGLYGAPPDFCPTPRIDSFFGDGLILDAVSPSTWTPSVIASMLSGLMPWEHGVIKGIGAVLPETNESYLKPNKKFDSVCAGIAGLDRLKVLFTANNWLHPRFGFSQGFHLHSVKGGWAGETYNKEVKDIMAELRRTSFLLFLHYMDTHQPYTSLPEKKIPMENIRAHIEPDPRKDPLYQHDFETEVQTYNSSVATADHYVGQLIDMLEQEKLLDNTIVAFFSDHGEELRERGRLEFPRHSHSLYNELLNVPLLIRFPPALREHASQQMEPFAEKKFPLIHMFPLIRTLAGGGPADPAWFSPGIISIVGFNKMLVSIIEDDFKLIRNLDDETEEFYNLKNDPGERNSIPAHERAAALREKLCAATPATISIPWEEDDPSADPEEMAKIQKHLKSLGYM